MNIGSHRLSWDEWARYGWGIELNCPDHTRADVIQIGLTTFIHKYGHRVDDGSDCQQVLKTLFTRCLQSAARSVRRAELRNHLPKCAILPAAESVKSDHACHFECDSFGAAMAALAMLPELNRTIVQRRISGEHNQKLAKDLGLSETQVCRRYYQSLDWLRCQIDKDHATVSNQPCVLSS